MGPVAAAIGRLVVPLALTIATAFLVKGYTGPGDGFVAGALVAVALGLQLVAAGPAVAARQPLIRHAGAIAMAGLALALLVAFAPVVAGDPPFSHLPAPGAPVTKIGSVELTTAFAFDIAVFLVVAGAVAGILGRLSVTEEARA